MVDCGKRGLLRVESKRTLSVVYIVYKVETYGTSYGPNMNALPIFRLVPQTTANAVCGEGRA